MGGEKSSSSVVSTISGQTEMASAPYSGPGNTEAYLAWLDEQEFPDSKGKKKKQQKESVDYTETLSKVPSSTKSRMRSNNAK